MMKVFAILAKCSAALRELVAPSYRPELHYLRGKRQGQPRAILIGIKTSVAAVAQSSAVGSPELICSVESKLLAARTPPKPGSIPV